MPWLSSTACLARRAPRGGGAGGAVYAGPGARRGVRPFRLRPRAAHPTGPAQPATPRRGRCGRHGCDRCWRRAPTARAARCSRFPCCANLPARRGTSCWGADDQAVLRAWAVEAGQTLVAPSESVAGQPGSGPHDPLSACEMEVLGSIARGLSNKRIARELALSPQTVKRASPRSGGRSRSRAGRQLLQSGSMTGPRRVIAVHRVSSQNARREPGRARRHQAGIPAAPCPRRPSEA